MKPLREYNLELGRPTVDEALRRLEGELRSARLMHAPAVKLIHGYGSSGKGGRIRTACRAYLQQEKDAGHIRDFICGEDFSIFNEATRRILGISDSLRQDRDLDNDNRGITVVILQREKF